MLNEYILVRIRTIQQELREIENMVARQAQSPVGRTQLKGLWKGVRVDQSDFEDARKAVFREAHAIDL